MSAPFRKIHSIESAIGLLELAEVYWKSRYAKQTLNAGQGLSLFGIFNQNNTVPVQKEGVLQPTNKIIKP